MLNRLMRALLFDVYQKYFFRKVRRGSIQAVKGYIQAVRFLRLGLMGILVLACLSALMVTGLLLAIIGTLGLFPISDQARAISILLIGVLLVIIPGIVFLMMFTERRWLEASKSYELMDAVLAPWPDTVPPNPLDVISL